MPCVMKICAFTGNRPDKLPWGYDENDSRCRAVKQSIYDEVVRSAKEGFTCFISGMAQGGDTYFAEAVLIAKKAYDITLECAVPYRAQSLRWSHNARLRYDEILSQADAVTVLSESYTPWCNHVRNRYMVDNCSRLIALSSNVSGGTKYTLEYAAAKKIEIIYIDWKKS